MLLSWINWKGQVAFEDVSFQVMPKMRRRCIRLVSAYSRGNWWRWVGASGSGKKHNY